MNPPRVLFFVRRVGPYHDARFNAAGRRLDLRVVETRPDSTEYPWTTAAGARHYQLDSFRPAQEPEAGLRGEALAAEVARALQTHRPDVVACAGWADREYHALLRRCLPLAIPAVAMSDSTVEDEPRRWWHEQIKGSYVKYFAAAMVAGARSQQYLLRLGFPAAAIFRASQDHATDGGGEIPRRFLCVARFIPKKNLAGLLAAYASYVDGAGAEAWDLVLSGSGPLEASLRAQVAALGLSARVTFAGFLQYADLPAAYARAGALVLPSWSDQWGLVVNEAMAAGLPVIVSHGCGCTPELVRAGENGLTFDPGAPAALTACLRQLAQLDATQWRAMGRRSREIIGAYSPESYAVGFTEAVAYATARRRGASPRLSRVVVRLLAALAEGAL